MSTQTFDKRKGQSAIEYLMTYGWMLLVVAIVGGAIFATVQGQCLSDTTGFESAEISVSDFEVGDNLQLEVSNNAGESVTLEQIYVGPVSTSVSQDIGSGESAVIDVTGITRQEGSCNDFDLSLQYQRGDFASANSTGTITGELGP